MQEELQRLEEEKRSKIPESVKDAVKELERGTDWGPQGLVIHLLLEQGNPDIFSVGG
jgi:hypothetical protein